MREIGIASTTVNDVGATDRFRRKFEANRFTTCNGWAGGFLPENSAWQMLLDAFCPITDVSSAF